MAKYEPRHVYVISWDTANTDLTYFCSHNDQVLDGVSSANIFYGDIINASTHSQGLDPIRANATIGGISFTFLDNAKALTALLNSKLIPTDSPLSAAKGLRGKRVQHWIGEKGAEWSSGYDLIQTQQIHDSIQVVENGNGYRFTARDIQRSELEDIFDPKKTTLTSALSKTGITINVTSTTGFELIQHGASYSDAPNDLVGYVLIDKEKIRFSSKTSNTFTVDNAQSTLNGALAKDATSIVVTDASGFDSSGVGYIDNGASPAVLTEIKWASKTSNTLTGVTGVTVAHSSGNTIVASNGRGVLGTIPKAYSYDSGATDRVKVEEHIYYELPAIKFAYAILTGSLYGTSPISTIPSHHTLSISTDWISTSQFIQYTDDLWDPADDTYGVILRFDGLKKTNAKKFIEEELLFWTGTFSPILNTGELGLKRMSGVISDAAHSGVLNEDNVISISNITFDLNNIHNNVVIDWNYDSIANDFTRTVDVTDTDSQTKWGKAKTLNLKSKGLHGSIHTDNILKSLFNVWRDRYTGPPFKASVVLDYTQRNIKVGDIKRLQLSHIPEFTDQSGQYSALDASVEVQRVSVNHTSGTITVEVFGSTQKAEPLALGTDNSPIADAWFTSEGTDISTVTTNTLSGGGTICTIDGASSLTGVDDLSSLSPSGVYYWDGDLTISDTVQISKNVELRVNGFLTFTSAGKIDGKGRGLAGGTSGLSGAIGNSQAGGGLRGYSKLVNTFWGWDSTESAIVDGLYSSMPPFILENGGGTSVTGKPRNLQGTSGGKGGDLYYGSSLVQAGSNGGNGGAGLSIFCKGASGVSGSQIDLSGNDGTAGVKYTTGFPDAYAGSGAGGQAGGLSLYLVGNTVTETLSDYFVANNGDTPIVGKPVNLARNFVFNTPSAEPLYSFYTGISSRAVTRANLLVDWVPDNLTPSADAASIAETGTLISFTENSNVPQTPAENLATIDITITPPIDTSYSHSMVSYKVASDDDTQYQRLPYPAKNETTVTLAMDGTEYSFRAYPVNIEGVESTDFIEKNFTISTAAGFVILQTGNSLKTSATVGAGTSGQGVIIDSAGQRGYNATGVVKYSLDATTGLLTCTDANVSGTITAAAGDIGGWNISSTQIVSDNNRVILDSSSQYIQVQNVGGTNYIRMNADGLVGVDSVLGTVFNIPTDGSAPTFASGIINSTVFNITSAGILRTSATVGDGSANSAGVLINDTGVKGFPANSSTAKFFLDASNGTITASDATISGAITIGSGSSGIANLSDAGALATANSADWSSQVAGTGKPANNADVTQAALISGTTITGGGITLSSGGSIKGGQTAYATGTGFFLGYESAAYKFSIGSSSSYARWTGAALEVQTGSTTTKGITINPGGDNELHFYGDRGDGTVEELASIGIKTVGADNYVGIFGSAQSGSDRIGLLGQSYSSYGVSGYSYSNNGVYGYSALGRAVYAYAPSSEAVYAVSHASYGVYGYSLVDAGVCAQTGGTTLGAFKIIAKANTTDPTTGGIGQFSVLSDGTLRYHNGTDFETLNNSDAVAGAVGTYTVGWNATASNVAMGATLAGSSIRVETAFIDGGFDIKPYPTSGFPTTSTTTLSGTWKAMMFSPGRTYSDPYYQWHPTLWLRIS